VTADGSGRIAAMPVVGSIALALASACSSPPPAPPPEPCVAGYVAGQQLRVRLGPPYDATSSFFFDTAAGTSLHRTGDPDSSCDGLDDFHEGDVVTFALREPFQGRRLACIPWEANAGSIPASEVPASHPIEWTPGETIAGTYVRASTANDGSYISTWLVSPSGDPNAAAAARKLPPLVFLRAVGAAGALGSSSDWGGCANAWTATWEP